jgi:hypothetical protein
MQKFKTIFGLEVEGYVSSDLGITLGNRHVGNPISRYWRAEGDGSLTTEYAGSSPVELTNKRPFSKDRLKHVLKDLENRLGCSFPIFDRTTGAHIHFNLMDTETGELRGLKNVANVQFLRELGQKIRLNMYNGLETNKYRLFRNHYWRSYSGPLSERDIKMLRSCDKFPQGRGEFSYSSHLNTIEYRSFNLLGAQNWEDVYKYYSIALNTIDGTIQDELMKLKPFNMYFKPLDRIRAGTSRSMEANRTRQLIKEGSEKGVFITPEIQGKSELIDLFEKSVNRGFVIEPDTPTPCKVPKIIPIEVENEVVKVDAMQMIMNIYNKVRGD